MALQPVRFTLPLLSPKTRCALTAPFHPYPIKHNLLWRYILCGTVCLHFWWILPFQEARHSMLSGLSSPINWSDKAACFTAKVRQIIAVQPLSHLFRSAHNSHHKSAVYPFSLKEYKSLPSGGLVLLHESIPPFLCLHFVL
jgi:hypothetical protein